MFRFLKTRKKTTASTQNLCCSIEDFHQKLRIECRRSSYNEQEFSLVLLTLDPDQTDPKQVQHLIRRIHHQIREIDVIGRYNAESIGIIMPYTAETGARGFINKIIRSIAGIENQTKYALFRYLPNQNRLHKINADTA